MNKEGRNLKSEGSRSGGSVWESLEPELGHSL